MPGNTLAVRPGAPQQMSGANWNDGTTIFNNDPNNAVWVGSSNTVAPGRGAQVTPFGSVQWSAKNGVPWACVDTGVLTPVNLYVSNDVGNMDNPVALGTAIALQIFASGVPIINKDPVLLYSNAGPIAGNGAQIVSGIDASPYDFITVLFITPNANRDAAFLVQWDVPASAFSVNEDVVTFPLNGLQLNRRTAVNGSTFELFFNAATPTDTITNLLVYGDNTARPEWVVMVNGANYLAKGSIVAVGTARIPPSESDTVSFYINVTGAAATYKILAVNSDFSTVQLATASIATNTPTIVTVNNTKGLELQLSNATSSATIAYTALGS